MTAVDARYGSASPGIRQWIGNHALISFFVMANVLSWAAWTPYILSQNGIGLWDYTFPSVMGTSQLTGMLPGAYLGPIFSALVITAVVDGRTGLRVWAGRLFRWRVEARWYALALIASPAALVVAGAAFSGGRIHAPTTAALVAYVPVLLLQMVTTGLAEEPGWRDFALPRLQERFGALRAAMILGPIWGVWHLPLFFTEWGGWPDASWTRPVIFVVFCISFNVVMSWVFNRTGQSLPVSMLMHVSVNTFASVMWADLFPALDTERAMLSLAVAAVVAAMVVIVGTCGRLGYDAPRIDSPA
ncbi:CPBP family intramembrane metalloprotease [Rhodococcus fascians]|nr:CPBP family intramembrane metalloprotease [Rhodococcus fascians]MBY4238052.1 CPBP family intramembrane metalloprotease [Rhodococcus fascians]MBY4254027.1 CPBP family intramembrane metalloprotease [Rhodococcus fascians]MBY4269589.1 CPBP family intramembrane metalloprotease [Rhodococcus fascians]